MPEFLFNSMRKHFFGSRSVPFSSAARRDRSAALRAAFLACTKDEVRFTEVGVLGYGRKVLLTCAGPPPLLQPPKARAWIEKTPKVGNAPCKADRRASTSGREIRAIAD